MFRLTSAILVALVATGKNVSAFVPHSPSVARFSTARHFGVDPSSHHFQDLSHQLQHLPQAFSSLTLSDAMDALGDAASSAAAPVADVVEEAAKADTGWFGFLTEPIQIFLQFIHSSLMMAGLSENSWGVSIVMLTVLIKLVTFPLTKTQLESTNKMQVSLM